MTARQLLELVRAYLAIFPDEQAELELLLSQLNDREKLNDRNNFRGHITAGGIVLSPDRSKILLIHHIGFNRWQQPGGHWESDEEADPLAAARREVFEETGINPEEYNALDANSPLIPLDIDTHWVTTPRHKNELPHYHHDFRYVFISEGEKLSYQKEEVYGADWFELDDTKTTVISDTLQKLRLLV